MKDLRQDSGLPPSRPPFARWLGTTNDVTSVFLSASRVPGLINLGGGLPDAETYPVDAIAEIAHQAILSHPNDCLGYGPIAGLPELRDCIAARFSSEHLQLSRENIFVTSGGMQGLELIGKVLLDEGGLVAAQFPTYLGALDAWRPRSPAYRNLRLEDPGFNPQEGLAGAQFAYTVPNFSNPTGRLVDVDMRTRLVDAADTLGTWLVEDDPYGTLQYDGVPLPRMIELSARKRGGKGYDGSVVYMGTMSKQISPGLRVGWIIAAPDMVEALIMAKQGSDLCTSGLTQRIALGAFESGLIDTIQPAMVALYQARRDALCAALAEHASDWLTFQKPVGGMFVWATLRDPDVSTDHLLHACLRAGVCVSPSSAFDAFGRNTRSVRLNFTLNTPDKLHEAVLRIVKALKEGDDLRERLLAAEQDLVGLRAKLAAQAD